MFGKRHLLALGLALGLSSLAQADQYSNLKSSYNTRYHCGEGIITGVIVGGYGWTGLHLEVDWTNGRQPPSTALYQNTVRILASDLSAENMRRITAAAWLAYANGHYVRFGGSRKVSGTAQVDCGRVTELQISTPR